MKKITLLLSLVFLAFSCSSDDNEGSSESTSDVIGIWKLTSKTVDEVLVELDLCELQVTLEFTDTEYSYNGVYLNGEDCDFYTDGPFSYEIDGKEFYYTYTEGEFKEEFYEGEISISDNILTIDDEELNGGNVSGSVRVFTKVVN